MFFLLQISLVFQGVSGSFYTVLRVWKVRKFLGGAGRSQSSPEAYVLQGVFLYGCFFLKLVFCTDRKWIPGNHPRQGFAFRYVCPFPSLGNRYKKIPALQGSTRRMGSFTQSTLVQAEGNLVQAKGNPKGSKIEKKCYLFLSH